jgi:hypothetical protein
MTEILSCISRFAIKVEKKKKNPIPPSFIVIITSSFLSYTHNYHGSKINIKTKIPHRKIRESVASDKGSGRSFFSLTHSLFMYMYVFVGLKKGQKGERVKKIKLFSF